MTNTEPVAKEQYDKYMHETEEKNPLERLRFFCSLAMRSQDWLDVEALFKDVESALQAERERADEYKARADTYQKLYSEQYLETGNANQRAEKAEESLRKQTKQIGVACDKHDLIHALTCGYCHREAEAERERAEKELALARLIIQQKIELLASCESALGQTQAELAALKEALRNPSEEMVLAGHFELVDNVLCNNRVKAASAFKAMTANLLKD